MTAARDLARGASRALLGRALSVVLNFFGWALLARALGPSGFGLIAFALGALNYLASATDLGLATLGSREFPRQVDPRVLVARIVGLKVVLAVVGAAVIVVVAVVAPIDPDARGVGLVMASWLLSVAFDHTWVLRGQERGGAVAIADVAGAVAMLVAVVALVHGPEDVVIGAIAAVSSPWVTTIVAIALASRRTPFSVRVSEVLPLLRAALPLGLSAIAVAVYFNADTVILGIFRPESEVGMFGAAGRLVVPWIMGASIVGLLALPQLSRLLHHGSAEVLPLLRSTSLTLLAVGLPVAVGTLLTASQLVVLVFGDDYAAAAVPLSILILSCVTFAANVPFGFLMLARGQDRAYMLTTVAAAAFRTVLGILLIPELGMVGAALIALAAEVVFVSLVVWFTRDVARPLIWNALRRAVPATAIMAAAVYPVRDSLLAFPVGIMVYGVAAVLTGALPPLHAWVRLARPTR